MLKRKKASSEPEQKMNDAFAFEDNRPVKQRTYGNVLTRVWKNESSTGEIGYTFSQNRIYERKGEQRLAKSFNPSDFEDVIRGCQWIAGFIKKPTTKREPDSKRPDLRVQRINARRAGGQK